MRKRADPQARRPASAQARKRADPQARRPARTRTAGEANGMPGKLKLVGRNLHMHAVSHVHACPCGSRREWRGRWVVRVLSLIHI
eukprot:904918-Alexandrium_andersonii.AAC.1